MIFLEGFASDITIIGFIVVAFLLVWIVFEFRSFKETVKERMGMNNETTKLQLQAYERLTLFAERTNLISLTTRLMDTSSSCRVLQMAMVENIKAEYEYNTSQQIYISPELWKAVTKLKEQNIYIINQLATALPADATSLDFAKVILEYTNQNNAELSAIVLDAIHFETNKLL